MLTLEHASRLYQVPLVDYGADRGRGLLVSSGAGMMMAIMDQCARIRWCVDIDALPRRESVRVADFLLLAEPHCDPIGVCGWFSITNPEEMLRAVRQLRAPSVYLGNVRAGLDGECDSLRAFIERLQGDESCNPGFI
jgi:hypothetical protein